MPQIEFSPPQILLTGSLPDPFPAPKYHLGQQVYWALVATHDRGRIIGCVFAQESTIQAIGFHYLVQLNADSPSKCLGIEVDWGFESDLAPLADRPSLQATPLC